MTSTEAVRHGDALDERRRLRQARLCFAGLVVIVGGLTVSVPLTLPIGDLNRSEPGFWVFWVGVITTALIAFALIRPRLLLDAVDGLTRSDLRNVAMALPVLVFAVPLLTLSGVAITTVLVAFYWFKAVTHTSWLASLIGTACVSAGILIVFIFLLDVPFPAGSLTGF